MRTRNGRGGEESIVRGPVLAVVVAVAADQAQDQAQDSAEVVQVEDSAE